MSSPQNLIGHRVFNGHRSDRTIIGVNEHRDTCLVPEMIFSQRGIRLSQLRFPSALYSRLYQSMVQLMVFACLMVSIVCANAFYEA